MTTAQSATYHRQYLRWHAQQERAAKRVVLARFRVMARQLLTILNASGSASVLASLDFHITTDAHEAILQAIYVLVGESAALREYDRLAPPQKSEYVPMQTKDRDVPPLRPQKPQQPGLIRINLFSEQWRARMIAVARSSETASRITGMTERTRQLVRDAIAEANTASLDIRALGRRIRAVIVDPVRALLIARTETTRAASIGHELAAESSNLLLNKQWIATADGRTRADHAAMLGSKPIAKDGVFMVGGVAMRFPGDPAGGAAQVVNCRCALLYVPVSNLLNLN